MDAGAGEMASLHDATGSYDALLTHWRRSGLAASAGSLVGTLILPGQYWSETAGDVAVDDASWVLAGGGGKPRSQHHGTTTYVDLLMDTNSGSSQAPARPAPLYLISAQLVGQGHGTGYGDAFGGVPAADEAVAALPATAYCGGRRGEEEEECCAVCREECVHGDALRTMPCKHGFHEACILPWLRVSRLCPLCRFALPAQAAAETAGSEEEEDGDNSGTEGDDDGD